MEEFNTSKLTRKSGMLLHPTSLPCEFGVGDLGPGAYSFVDFLEQCGMTLWQVLPLGPTGYGDSPYASFSTHAGNPMLISPELLKDEGYIHDSDLIGMPSFEKGRVDYGLLIPWKKQLLTTAAKRFINKSADKVSFDKFCMDESLWLNDFALFIAVKESFDKKATLEGVNNSMWSSYWDKDIALREEVAIKKWSIKLEKEILYNKVIQYLFFEQWLRIKNYTNNKGIQIVGDIPIFVAPDSVDVWANRELFLLDDNGKPTCVAGVPPDYFSETGQLWGNPLYNWKVMEKRNFKWWIDRIKSTLKMVDIIRVDHFRGFEAYWEVPANEVSALNGQWIKAPGFKLFKEISKCLGELPILAEDLGVITKEVTDLRDSFNFPGMRILQFAFDSTEGDAGINPKNAFQPHNFINNSVVYTGTHDNSTMKGWIEKSKNIELDYIRNYFDYWGNDLVWLFIRNVLMSTSGYAIIPLQDYLELGDEARMNIPSTTGGNWSWRYDPNKLTKILSEKIMKYNTMYGRI